MTLFQIDTKGACLLCLCISDSASEATPVNSIPATGFKMFLRYLKIDIMDLGHFSSSLRPHLNGPDSVDISVDLCQNCCSLTNQFLQLFQQFERVRLQLDNCAQKLHQAILEGGRDENRVREYRKRVRAPGTSHISPMTALNISIAERLREKTLEKCALRLASSTPKILITELTLPPLKYSPGPATTSHKIITKKSGHKSVFTDAKELSSESDIIDNSCKEEIEDIGYISPPPLMVTEEPALEETKPVFVTELYNVTSQPTKPENSEMAVSAKVGTPPPEQAMVSPSPTCMQPEVPILDEAQAHCSSKYPEFSQDHGTQAMESLNKDGIIDMDFDGDSDNDVPTNDPLELESDPVTVQSSSSSLSAPADKYFEPIKLLNGKVKCPQCKKILGSMGTFPLHQGELHMTKKVFRCKHCNITVGTRRALVNYMKVVHTFQKFSDRFPVGTTETEFTIVVEGLLKKVKQDLATYRETGGGGNYCTLCGEVIPLSYGSWRDHILCFHVDHIISKLEKSKHNSNRDINVQSEDSSLKKTPPLQSSLIRKPEGSLDIDKTFEDGDCDKNTPTNDPLELEEGPVMAQAASPSPAFTFKPIKLSNGRFKCPLCGKILRTHNSIRKHYREVHMNKHAFGCKHCRKTFPRKHGLLRHIKVVHSFLEFSGKFPVGTTETEFSHVIEDLLIKVKQDLATYRETGGGGNYCTLCGKVIKLHSKSWRQHILWFHVDHIISKLERSKHNSNRDINVQSEDSSLNKMPPLQSSLILKIESEEVIKCFESTDNESLAKAENNLGPCN